MSDNEMIVSMTAIVLGMMMFLIPIAGLTARFALKPIVEALSKYREVSGQNEAQQLAERRLSLLEEQLHGMDRTLRDLAEESDFRRQLESGRNSVPATLAAPRAEPLPADR